MTGLFLHRSDDAPALAAELASRLGGPRTDPFALDLVVTPHAHLRRWLTNELAHRLGRPGDVGPDAQSFQQSNRAVEQRCRAAIAAARAC